MHNHDEQEIRTLVTAIAERLATMTGGTIRNRNSHSALIELDHKELNAGQWLRVRYNRYSKSANGVEVEYSPGYGIGRSRTYTKLNDANLKKIAALFVENYQLKVSRAKEAKELHDARMVRKTRRTELLARILTKEDDIVNHGFSERVSVQNLGVNLYVESQRDNMKLMFEGSEEDVATVLFAIRTVVAAREKLLKK